MSKAKNEQKAFVINSLVGLYFLSFIGEDVNWQGLVIGETESAYICQLFSWVVGEPTDIVLIHKTSMEEPGRFTFYRTAEDLSFAYNYRFNPSRGRE